MLLGGLIYLGFRDTTLIMFHWFFNLGLEDFIYRYRLYLSEIDFDWPIWLIFSLPNVLWLISGILLFDAIWSNSGFKQPLIWVAIFCSIAIFAEIFQYFGIIPGTFDLLDLLPMVLIFLLYFFILLRRKIYYG